MELNCPYGGWDKRRLPFWCIHAREIGKFSYTTRRKPRMEPSDTLYGYDRTCCGSKEVTTPIWGKQSRIAEEQVGPLLVGVAPRQR